MAKTVQKKKPVSIGRIRNLIQQTAGDYYDFRLLAVILLLVCFGVIMLYSTSAYTAELRESDDMFYFKKQTLISSVCLVLAVFLSFLDYHLLTKVSLLLYAGALGMMALVRWGPFGYESHGARRWIKITRSLTIQPAEIAKIAVIVILAVFIARMGRKVRTIKALCILFLLGLVQAGAAYILTDNLSTAIIIAGITLGMIFVAHPDYKNFLILAIVGSAGIFLFVSWIRKNVTVDSSTAFRLRRILVWLHPEDYASGDGYQTLQALYAIGSGGFFGRGFGNSIQKLGSVPEAQNDFIFAIICEELGAFGGILLLIVFAYLLYRLFFIAQNAPDVFGSMLVSGIFIHIALQVILNISVVLNVVPNTGVTLPFISYGGTSVLFLMTEMGIALSVARQIRFRQPKALI